MGERGFYWHAQNLNERADESCGPMWRHGRAWFRWGDWSFHPTWLVGQSRFCFLEISFDRDDEPFTFKIALPPVALWLSFSAPFIRRWLPSEDRNCGISIHDWCIWINPWSKSMEWAKRDPWWVRGLVIHVDDLLFGKVSYACNDLRTSPVRIELDGRVYTGTCAIEMATWSWPRWFTQRMTRARIDIPAGIPIPGKGENSYDCGEDAVYGTTCEARDESEGVAKLLESVMRSRERYGGTNWKPEALRSEASA